MCRQVRRRAPIILGLLGSIVGLLYSYAVMSNNGDGCKCDCSFIQTFLGSPLVIGSVVGLAACVLYPVARKPSGIFLLSGAILASPLPLIIAVGSWQYLGSLLLFSVLFFAPSYFASLLFLLGWFLTFHNHRLLFQILHL